MRTAIVSQFARSDEVPSFFTSVLRTGPTATRRAVLIGENTGSLAIRGHGHTVVGADRDCKTREASSGVRCRLIGGVGKKPETTVKLVGEPLHAVHDSDRDITVMIVDDSDMFRVVLGELIAATSGFVLVGEACSGEEALEAIGLLCPQLVLMDIRMPGIGGVGAARAILRRSPQPLVMLISADEPELQPGVRDLSEAVARVRKQDLGPGELSRIWKMHTSATAAGEPRIRPT